jgi:hypothetical protein
MAPFKDVFSTTARVVVFLLIISAAIGVAFPSLSGLSSAVTPADSNPIGGASGEEETDTIRNAAPAPAWDHVITKAVANRCVTDGMNAAEVLQAVGEPNVRYDDPGISSWTWHPRMLNETTMFFTPKGHVYLWNSGCKSLRGIVTNRE